MNPPDRGDIRLDGKPVALDDQCARRSSKGIAYVPEDRLTLGLVLEQPISSNIPLTVLDAPRRPAWPDRRRGRGRAMWRNGSHELGDQGVRPGQRR